MVLDPWKCPGNAHLYRKRSGTPKRWNPNHHLEQLVHPVYLIIDAQPPWYSDSFVICWFKTQPSSTLSCWLECNLVVVRSSLWICFKVSPVLGKDVGLQSQLKQRQELNPLKLSCSPVHPCISCMYFFTCPVHGAWICTTPMASLRYPKSNGCHHQECNGMGQFSDKPWQTHIYDTLV
jgi:hypothetical protein